MARLYRFVKLQDRFDTQVFTFILPGSLGQDSAHRDVESKDFLYGNHKWGITITRNDANIGAFLTLKNMTDGLTCILDFSFTFTNREHFTKNDTFNERNCKFNTEKFKHGRKNFVSSHDLAGRGFLQENGNYLVNVELRNVTTGFEQVIQLPSETSKSLQIGSANRHQKFETGYFSFGNFDWNLVLFPFGDSAETDGRPLLYLVRQTGLDHHCRVRYKLILGEGDRALVSETIEQLLDTSGQGPPYQVPCSLYSLTANKNKLHIKVELLTSTAISECHLFPLNRNKNQSHLYDRDKQAWMLESDTSLTHLKFRLFYTDARNVPRRHMRYTSFGVSVVPRRGNYKPIPAVGVPYGHYYTQMDVDVEGFDIPTDITVKESRTLRSHSVTKAPPLQLMRESCNHSISNPASAILDREHRMTVQVEWVDSHLLYDDYYNRLDEVDSRHKYQMAREIMALQAENLTLEKQLHSYQVSIARNNSKGQLELPKELSVPGSPEKSPGKRSAEHRSSRRDRSRDRRRKDDNNGGEYQYSERSIGEGFKIGGELYNPGTETYKDGRRTSDTYKVSDSYNGEVYPDDPYREEHHYYNDRYGDVSYPEGTGYAATHPEGTGYPATHHPEGSGYPSSHPEGTGYPASEQYYDYCDNYTADQYTENRYSPSEKYSDTRNTQYSVPDKYSSTPYSPPRTFSPEKVPESVPYPYPDTYTEDYVRHNRTDKLSHRSTQNGSRRGRDLPTDDGYFSSQSAQLQAELLAQQNTGPGLVSQYLETYPEERTERSSSSGRRSPSVRSKHSKKAATDNHSHEGAGGGMSRDRPKSRRHKDK